MDKERLEQLPRKWDLADQLPSNLPKDFIESSILRSNHQAIDIAKIKIHAQTKGLDWQKFNQSVAEITSRLKPTFTYQSEALNEIENKIFAEASQTSGKASFEQSTKENIVQKSTKIEKGLEF